MRKLVIQFKLFICLALLLCPWTVQAAQVSLEAHVDRAEVRLGDSLELKVTVKGTQSAGQPMIPKTKDFNLSYHGKSSQFKMANGITTSSVVHSYTVFPMREGSLTIGPINVAYKGQKLTARPITVRVLPADAKVKEAKPLLLRAMLSDSSPYYNQQIIYTLQFGRRVDTANARVEMPSFEGFWVEDLGEQRELQRVIDGHTYMVIELRKILFPNKTGPFTIAPAAIQCDVAQPRDRNRRRSKDPFFDSFFSGFRQRYQTKVLHSLPLKVEVKPLPEKGKPDKFYPLVGKVTIDSQTSKKTLEVGDSSTITITVSGNVNIRDASLLEPALGEDFKVYDDKPSVEFIPQENSLLGKKTFKKAIVPLNPGQLQIPSYKIAYFDPKSGRYKFAATKPLSLTVTAPAEKEKLHSLGLPPGAGPKEAIKILGKDILAVYTHPEALTDKRLSPKDYLIYAILFFLPTGSFLGLLSFRTSSLRQQRNAGALRKKRALKQAERNLKSIHSLLDKPAEFYAQISKIIQEYLADKLDLPGGILTPQEVQGKLEKAKVEEKLIHQLTQLMEQCEFCQFASTDKGHDNCQQVLKNTKQLLSLLDKVL